MTSHKIPATRIAGDQWEHYLEIATRVVDEYSARFNDREVDFCANMLTKLEQYNESAYLTEAQANWLDHLHQRLQTMEAWDNQRR